jgi:hypothetical protein
MGEGDKTDMPFPQISKFLNNEKDNSIDTEKKSKKIRSKTFSRKKIKSKKTKSKNSKNQNQMKNSVLNAKNINYGLWSLFCIYVLVQIKDSIGNKQKIIYNQEANSSEINNMDSPSSDIQNQEILKKQILRNNFINTRLDNISPMKFKHTKKNHMQINIKDPIKNVIKIMMNGVLNQSLLKYYKKIKIEETENDLIIKFLKLKITMPLAALKSTLNKDINKLKNITIDSATKNLILDKDFSKTTAQLINILYLIIYEMKDLQPNENEVEYYLDWSNLNFFHKNNGQDNIFNFKKYQDKIIFVKS